VRQSPATVLQEERLGENGCEPVRTNFLLTCHLRDYLLLVLFVEHTDLRTIVSS
jgi:hypothetical protein